MSSVQQIGSSEFKSSVLESDQPVVVDFYATWCGPCKAVSPIIEALSQSYDGKVKFVKIDIDDANDVAANCNITGVPTLVLYKDGQEVGRKVGALPKPAMESWIKGSI